jgi:two-component system, NarL family, response regulator DegU
MSNFIKLIIADDHKIFRTGLAGLLKSLPRIKTIREAENGKEVLEILEKESIDIVLMDISMPVMDGLEATKIITEKYPGVKVIALSMHDDQNSIFEMNACGAFGYLFKNSDIDELERALYTVMKNEKYYGKDISRVLMEQIEKNRNKKPVSYKYDPINERDKIILQYICQGLSTIEIAQKMGLAEKTVEGHKTRMFQKTGSTNIASLVMFAVKHNLIEG